MKQSRLAASLVLWLFPVVVVLLLAGLVVGAIAASSLAGNSVPARIIIQWVAIPLAIAVVLAAREAWRFRPAPAEGIEVTAAEHPRLWSEVNELANLAETEPPARVVIAPEVNAYVSEAAGQRELVIGLPLLATFTQGQLRSVLAHELGHFAGGDTEAAARIMRRRAFLDELRARASVVWRWFFGLYARLYAAAAGPASRAAELRADELSVQAAGPEVAASSFRALHRAEVAWHLLLENYLPLFDLSGRRASLGQGLRHLIDANATAIDEATASVIAEETMSSTDTHPPTRERIARFEAAGRAGVTGSPGPDADAPALDLLNGGSAWLDRAESAILTQDRPLASWDEVVGAGVQQSAATSTDQLGATMRTMKLGDGSLDSVLRLVDDPQGAVQRFTGTTGPEAREHTIGTLLDPVVAALLASGRAKVEASWQGPASIVAPDGTSLAIEEHLARAVDAGDSTQLRAWLADLGVDLASRPTASGGVPQWLAALSHMTGPWEGRRDVHLWTTGVLALPPLDKATIKQNKDQVSEKHQHPRLFGDQAKGLEPGRALEGSLWWDVAGITGGEVVGKLVKTTLRFTLADGSTLSIVGTLETAMVPSPEQVGAAVQYLTAPKA